MARRTLTRARGALGKGATAVLGWFDRHAGAVLVCLALTMGGLYATQVHQASERAACQAGYNQAFAVQLSERSRLSAASDGAQSDLLLGVSKALTLKPTTDPAVTAKRQAEFLDLFRDFDRAAAAVAIARAATPLPPIPNC